MAENRPFDVYAMPSLKGRDAPPEGVGKKKKNTVQFETPTLPFETESLKFKKPAAPPRTASSAMRKPLTPSVRNEEGLYAIRFKNYTWAHTDPDVPDHYANRAEIQEVLNNYDAACRSITGNNILERAAALQSVTDMLLDNLSGQLRAECREQMEMVEKSRESYAGIFMLLEEDSNRCREEIEKLKKENIKLEGDLTKVIETSGERVAQIERECNRQIKEKNNEMENKKQEYDLSMKRFLEQKSQLEEHVKALHKVFLDFQSDSVYITLEDLKQKQAQTEKKLHNKENEITKLNNEITKLLRKIGELDANKKMVEQANDELRRKLQNTISINRRLERQLKMDQFDEEEDGAGGVKKARYQQIDSTPYINVLQKLNQIFDKVADAIQKNNPTTNIPTQYNDEFDKILLSGNPNLMIQAVEKKVDEVFQVCETLDNIDFTSELNPKQQAIAQPRFLQYIALHLEQGLMNASTTVQQQQLQSDYNPFQHIRQIWQSKYAEDEWRKRTGANVSRFPEFVITYHMKGDETMFGALQKTGRLWKAAKKDKTPETKLFKRFCLEKYTTDELTFFLQVRYLLLGLTPVPKDTPRIMKVKLSDCQEILNNLVGQLSHMSATIYEKTEKNGDEEGMVDYAIFMTNFLEFYERERKKRRNAVRLMFQSKKFAQGESRVDFENYVGMVKSLGYNGNSDVIFELYREATLISDGEMNLDSLLLAMDNIGFHFYSIEAPDTLLQSKTVSDMKRNKLLEHWLKFGKWFEGFTRPIGTFDPWIRSQIIKEVDRVDGLFKNNSSVSSLYTEYVKLLDYFQYLLQILALGSNKAMTEEKSNRELLLYENLIDLLITFVVTDPDPDFMFTELV